MKKNKVIIFVIILIVTFFIILISRNIYLTNKVNELSKIYLNDVIAKGISIKEVETYIKENPDTIIFICSINDQGCNKLESKIAKDIKKKELTESFIYLNITSDKNEEEIKKIGNYFNYDLSNKKYPLLISFKKGEISRVEGNLNKSKFINFLEKEKSSND